MSFEIKIPSVGESITTAVVAQWHKKHGDPVAKGDLLLTLETDKVSTELAAEEDGVLEIVTPEGEEVEIGAVVGHINAAAEEKPASEKAPAGGTEAKAAAKSETQEAGEAEEEPAKSESAQDADEARSAAASDSGKAGTSGESKNGGEAGTDSEESAAPASAKPGKGKRSRLKVVRPDDADAETETVPADAAPGKKPAAPEDGGRTTRRRLSPLRRKIATQLVNAQQTAAILTTFNECDMSAVMRLRREIQESFVARHGVKLGFMSFFIKAVVQALRDVPQVNARIDGDELVQNHFYDIGVAVGTERGLIVPVIRDCDRKSFADLERAIGDFAGRAKEGRIELADLQGGVFTISNGGVYGSLLSTPILNPPQSGILGMHTIQERPVAVEGKVEIRPMMYLALSYDHRVIDGKEAVTFLVRVKECIEQPLRLMLGA